MNTRTIKAYMFVAVMLALGGSVLWHWQSSKKRSTGPQDTQTYMMGSFRPATKREIVSAKSTVIGQLSAFKADDYAKATTYQANGLRFRLGDPQRFRLMIENMYPEFSHYRAIEYGNVSASQDGDVLLVPIRLTGDDNVVVSAAYFLRRENGVYRVAGVDGGMHHPSMQRRFPVPPPTVHPPVDSVVQQPPPTVDAVGR